MGTGRIVVLVGPSSSGTTSIVEAFVALEADQGCHWHRMGIDDVLGRLGWQWVDVGWPSGRGPLAELGMSVVDGAAGPSVEVGPLLRSLLRGHVAGVAAMADQGIDVIADEVLLDATSLDDWLEALAGRTVTWVEVMCDRAEMDRREGARGDRPAGLSRAQRLSSPRPPTDVVLDTTAGPPEENARGLQRLLRGAN